MYRYAYARVLYEKTEGKQGLLWINVRRICVAILEFCMNEFRGIQYVFFSYQG